jgi:hypothetical protein
MKRIKVVGLCLVAVFAFSALVASGAQAATYRSCVSQKKGEYTTSTCTTKSAKPHKGHFELAPVEPCHAQKKGEYTDSSCTTKSAKPKKGHFEKTTGLKFTASSGPAILETPAFGANNIECSASTSTGEITSSKTATFQTHFTGCKFLGLPCKSAGPDSNPSSVAGEIITNLTKATLLGPGEKASGPEKLAVPAGQVWNELVSIEHAPYQAELECSGAVFARTFGSLAGVQNPVNTLSTSNTIAFSKTSGESGLETEVSETGFGGPYAGPARSFQNQTSTLTFEKPIDISTT